MSERPVVPSVSGAIYGIGTDIIQIERVEGVMQRTHGRFAEKVLGPDELRIYHARNARSARRGLAFLATRFAAKEAVSKAIGLGMHWPMTWRAVQTLNLPSGQPVVRYSGELADWIAQRGLHIQISVTDERDYAVAFAVAELQSKPSA
ncbi:MULTISPECIES: holo-ACP synthase [Ralstonia solanacearum species complex]|uniref:Holo-[acyl-carrier-protein] synthase n=1 Tax=Ralstonia syzygii TaxID=28097 RepID=A0ABX7ZGA6_9RALS|nr:MULTISPECIES: holo-ACP synthase [Ralstonia solanacearum species complex]AMP38094.1 holo-ACP synthase [Ralstonia solanacearum]AXV77495.1 holo-ACP synthase [Ralstonia solanacearum]AXV86921.1 holo-ACP synthase [Ralstonia solanacearum]AXV91516.1 holo-ACP synthase [Ralstonia solanacearum]AXW06418.1 holo-ACP synthase [Ralstonia solanacearum]